MTAVYLGKYEDARQGSRDLLAYALSDLGYGPRSLLHRDNGSPYLSGGPWVSISHTLGAAAVALSEEGPVGVDLERVRPVRLGLASRVMSSEECEWYLSRGRLEADFFTLWTLKESWFKYLGTGLPGFPNGTVFYLKGDQWRLSGVEQRFHVVQKDLLSMALCCDGQEVCIRWVRGS